MKKIGVLSLGVAFLCQTTSLIAMMEREDIADHKGGGVKRCYGQENISFQPTILMTTQKRDFYDDLLREYGIPPLSLSYGKSEESDESEGQGSLDDKVENYFDKLVHKHKILRKLQEREDFEEIEEDFLDEACEFIRKGRTYAETFDELIPKHWGIKVVTASSSNLPELLKTKIGIYYNTVKRKSPLFQNILASSFDPSRDEKRFLRESHAQVGNGKPVEEVFEEQVKRYYGEIGWDALKEDLVDLKVFMEVEAYFDVVMKKYPKIKERFDKREFAKEKFVVKALGSINRGKSYPETFTKLLKECWGTDMLDKLRVKLPQHRVSSMDDAKDYFDKTAVVYPILKHMPENQKKEFLEKTHALISETRPYPEIFREYLTEHYGIGLCFGKTLKGPKGKDFLENKVLESTEDLEDYYEDVIRKQYPHLESEDEDLVEEAVKRINSGKSYQKAFEEAAKKCHGRDIWVQPLQVSRRGVFAYFESVTDRYPEVKRFFAKEEEAGRELRTEAGELIKSGKSYKEAFEDLFVKWGFMIELPNSSHYDVGK